MSCGPIRLLGSIFFWNLPYLGLFISNFGKIIHVYVFFKYPPCSFISAYPIKYFIV